MDINEDLKLIYSNKYLTEILSIVLLGDVEKGVSTRRMDSDDQQSLLWSTIVICYDRDRESRQFYDVIRLMQSISISNLYMNDRHRTLSKSFFYE